MSDVLGHLVWVLRRGQGQADMGTQVLVEPLNLISLKKMGLNLGLGSS